MAWYDPDNWAWRDGHVEPGETVVFALDGVLSDARIPWCHARSASSKARGSYTLSHAATHDASWTGSKDGTSARAVTTANGERRESVNSAEIRNRDIKDDRDATRDVG